MFHETFCPSRSEYEKRIFHLDVTSKPSINIDLEQLQDVESSQTENSYVFEDGNGRDNIALVLDDNDGKEEQAPRYPRRERTKPDRDAYKARKGAEVDSRNIEEALRSTKTNELEEAIDQELKSLERNDTWKIVDRPKDVEVVPCKWVPKLKRNADRKNVKYKAGLVVRGNLDDTDLSCTFALVVYFIVIRLMLSIAPQACGKKTKLTVAMHSFKVR